jgi:hypothetical protein|tara:strand:+ start:1244 stop:2035 length:792 start_codon:yes stop_codon:yes gene_type:complete
MAIATGTAIAIGAAVSAGTATAGFISAGKRRREARDAADKAEQAFKKAEQIATENVMAGIEIPKEAFEQQRETVLTGVGQTLQAAQEGSQRGAAAAGSRAGATANQLADRLRAGKEEALFRADLLERRGARNVQRDLANLQLGVAQGAQRERADLTNAAAALQAGAVSNLASTAKQFLSAQNPFDPSDAVPDPNITQSQVDPNVTFNESALQAQILRPTQPGFGTTDLNPIIQPTIIEQPEIFQPLNPFEFAGIQGNYETAIG